MLKWTIAEETSVGDAAFCDASIVYEYRAIPKEMQGLNLGSHLHAGSTSRPALATL
jgi:hypothetical protein